MIGERKERRSVDMVTADLIKKQGGMEKKNDCISRKKGNEL